MYTGILYNAFVCWVSGLTGLIVFKLMQDVRKRKKVEYSQGLDYFSLLLGLVWVFVGTRNLFTWLNLPEVEIFVYKWFVGPLTYLHLVPAFYYIGWSFFRDKKVLRILFNLFFDFMILIAVFTLFKYGFSRPEPTYWGNNIVPNEVSRKILTYTLFAPAFLFVIIEFFRRLVRWRKTKNSMEFQLFGFSLGFLIYAVAGVIDALGIVSEWFMLLSRIGIMFVSLTFYLFVIWQE